MEEKLKLLKRHPCSDGLRQNTFLKQHLAKRENGEMSGTVGRQVKLIRITRDVRLEEPADAEQP